MVIFSRVFPFREGDKCCHEADSRGKATMFDKGETERQISNRFLSVGNDDF